MLEGKVVAITGAGRGIGRAIALEAARCGAKVVVNDYGGSLSGESTDENPAAEVVREIEAMGGEAIANPANIADPTAAASIVEDAVNRFGRLDALVNNAGIVRDVIFHKMTLSDWRAVIDINLTGYFNVSIAAAQQFRAQGSGAFVHYTSTSGLIGNFGQANYSAAKMGVLGLSNSIALDMARFGIRSNAVAPFAWSRMTETIPTTTEKERLRVERFKRMTPEKNAPLAVYLCSDAAADVNGQLFCTRMNEIFLFNRPMPIRSVHRSDGWTPQRIADELIPSLRPDFIPLRRTADVFSWDPI